MWPFGSEDDDGGKVLDDLFDSLSGAFRNNKIEIPILSLANKNVFLTCEECEYAIEDAKLCKYITDDKPQNKPPPSGWICKETCCNNLFLNSATWDDSHSGFRANLCCSGNKSVLVFGGTDRDLFDRIKDYLHGNLPISFSISGKQLKQAIALTNEIVDKCGKENLRIVLQDTSG